MKQVSIFSFAALLLLLSACGKHHDSTPVTPAVDSTALYLHLHTNLDTNEVEAYNEIYTTSAGRKISTSFAQLYISHVQLIKTDGSIYNIAGSLVLKVLETEIYALGNVPAGNYRSVRFHVGLDSAAGQIPSISMPALDHQDMWFSPATSASGYIFVNFEGRIDTTTNADGSDADMQPFLYKLGTGLAYKEVTMPDHDPVYECKKDIPQYIHLTIDYSKLFTGVQLNNNASLSVPNIVSNSTAIGTMINNNIPAMFSYED